MLTVPSEVKTLLKDTSTRKNLRIHFPNGERADITNKDIISESFEFNESICSQDEIKFGLCEASGVSFETANVGNIKGYTIDVAIEVIVDSTVEDAEYKSDIDKYVYSIPIGRFIVDSCDRNANNFECRKVRAYSNVVDISIADKFRCFDYYTFSKQETLNITDVDLLNLYYPENHTPYQTETLSFSSFFFHTQIFKTTIDNVSYSLKVTNYSAAVSEINTNQSGIYKIELSPIGTVFDDAKGELKDFGVSEKILKDIFGYKEYTVYRNGYVRHKNDTEVTAYELIVPDIAYENIKNIDDNLLGYFIMNNYTGSDSVGSTYDRFIGQVRGRLGSFLTILFPVNVELINNATNEVVKTFQFSVPGTYTSGFTPLAKSGNVVYSIQSKTYKNKAFNTDTGKDVTRTDYKFFPDLSQIDPRSIIEAKLELDGKMGKITRDGNLEIVNIFVEDSNVVPADSLHPNNLLYPKANNWFVINKSMYYQTWLADFPTKKYSSVTCSYINTSGENADASFTIVDLRETDADGNYIYVANDYQTYDISSNYIIQQGKFTEEQILGFLGTIGYSIRNIQYYPCEVDCIGLPYVESGDTYEVRVGNETYVGIVLERHSKGIQYITDNYSSK